MPVTGKNWIIMQLLQPHTVLSFQYFISKGTTTATRSSALLYYFGANPKDRGIQKQWGVIVS